ncbi:hypothetical protein [Streptomyces sp. NPDC001135]
MALRAGPLVAIPACCFMDLPWWARIIGALLGSAGGSWVWDRPDLAVEPAEHPEGANWYLARWNEWIACERGPLPDSNLVNVCPDDDKLTAIIVSTTARAALSVGQDEMSIVFDVLPRAVNVYRPDDMSASRAKLTVRLRTAAAADLDMDDLPAVWSEFGPYGGSELYDVQETEFGRQSKVLMPSSSRPTSRTPPPAWNGSASSPRSIATDTPRYRSASLCSSPPASPSGRRRTAASADGCPCGCYARAGAWPR